MLTRECFVLKVSRIQFGEVKKNEIHSVRSKWWYVRQYFKRTVDIHLPYITNIINLSIEEGGFPDKLRLTKVNPIFKKKHNLNVENYRPVSILPHVLNFFKEIIYYQINGLMADKLSKKNLGKI